MYSRIGPWGFSTKLSSAGLIYAHYGKAVIGSILGLPAEDADVGKLYEQIYKKFVEAIDAIDNGVNQFDGLPRFGDRKSRSGSIQAVSSFRYQLSSREFSNIADDAIDVEDNEEEDFEFKKSRSRLGSEWLPEHKLGPFNCLDKTHQRYAYFCTPKFCLVDSTLLLLKQKNRSKY
uniref:Uncharacterized protein n=1 Tax=Globodera rostochiensis TaxID=31243 RepID=A0A914H2Z7_GLORO